MRLALVALLLVGCRQIFGLHELVDKKDAGSAAMGDGRIDSPRDATGDGGIDAAIDAGDRVKSIQCGAGSACDKTMHQFCCSSASTKHCEDPAGGCTSTEALLSCDDASDCAVGELCCGSYDSSMTLAGATCTSIGAPCSQPTGGGIQYFCDPNGANQCPTGQQCTAPVTLVGAPPGYYYCQ